MCGTVEGKPPKRFDSPLDGLDLDRFRPPACTAICTCDKCRLLDTGPYSPIPIPPTLTRVRVPRTSARLSGSRTESRHDCKMPPFVHEPRSPGASFRVSAGASRPGRRSQSESPWIVVEAFTNSAAKDDLYAGRSRESLSQVSSRLVFVPVDDEVAVRNREGPLDSIVREHVELGKPVGGSPVSSSASRQPPVGGRRRGRPVCHAR
jgi:hypothetical protein